MAKRAAFVLFRGFEMLDLYGPVSVLGCHKLTGADRILTVSETARPVPTSMVLSTVTEYSIHTCPKPDVLILVGRQYRSLAVLHTILARPFCSMAKVQRAPKAHKHIILCQVVLEQGRRWITRSSSTSFGALGHHLQAALTHPPTS